MGAQPPFTAHRDTGDRHRDTGDRPGALGVSSQPFAFRAREDLHANDGCPNNFKCFLKEVFFFFFKFSLYLIILFGHHPFIAYGTDCVFLEVWPQNPRGQIRFRIQKLSRFVKFMVCALTPLAVSEGAFISKHIHFFWWGEKKT